MLYSNKKKSKLLQLILIVVFAILTNLLIYTIKYQKSFKNTIITKINDFIPNINYKIFERNSSSKNISSSQNINDTNGIIEIPKINLKEQLPNINSTDNDVNKNIYIIKESIFPLEGKNSHIILAAHSGYNKIAYFKRLPELVIGDDVYLYYNSKKYLYQITTFFEIEKTGKLIYKTKSNDDITLITCLKGTNKQIVYQGILISTSNREEKMLLYRTEWGIMQNYKEKILKQLEYQKDYINQTTYENNQSDLELITKIEKFIKKCSNFSKEKFDVWDQILEAIDSRISVKRLNIRSLKR